MSDVIDKPKLIYSRVGKDDNLDHYLCVFYFENKKQFDEYIKTVGVSYKYLSNANLPCIFLTYLTSASSKQQGIVHVKLSEHANFYIFYVDADESAEIILNTVCSSGDTLVETFKRIDNLISLCSSYNRHTGLNFLDNDVLNIPFDVDYFCNIVAEHIRFDLFNYFKNFISLYKSIECNKSDRPSLPDSENFEKSIILAYYYEDVLSVILSKYKIEGYDRYNTSLFLYGNTYYFNTMIALFNQYDSGCMVTSDFVEELAKLLLDMDFTSILTDYSLPKRTDRTIYKNAKLFSDFCKVFEDLDDRSLIFDNSFLVMSEAFEPTSASLRLASLQKDFSIDFVASMMASLHYQECIDSIMYNGEEVYKFQGGVHTYTEGHVVIRGHYNLISFFDCSGTLRIHMNERAFDSLKNFIRYAWVATVIRASEHVSDFGLKMSCDDIVVEDVEVKLNDTKDFILFNYNHMKYV